MSALGLEGSGLHDGLSFDPFLLLSLMDKGMGEEELLEDELEKEGAHHQMW